MTATHSADDLSTAFAFMEGGQMGGFAARLAAAWFVADSGNRAKIQATWPELIERAVALTKR